MLMDTTAVDWLEEEPRFEIVDHFFSTSRHHRLRVKCRVDEDSATAPSLVPLYGSANWMEREVYDMYGITFDAHPDMRRILLYPQFQGFPLRKDYDKLQAWPLFEARYEGTRETSTIIHPNPGELEPSHEP
jgi:NADH-quinone oxidoreductase subunit C